MVLVTRTDIIARDIVLVIVLAVRVDITLAVNIDTVQAANTDIIRAVIRATALAANTDITLVTVRTTPLADTVLAGKVIRKRKNARNGVRRKRLSLVFYSSCFA